jgi:hypothetical protein
MAIAKTKRGVSMGSVAEIAFPIILLLLSHLVIT